MLVVLSMLWGGSFFFNEVAIRELPVFTVVVSRVALAAVILFIIQTLRGERMPTDLGIWAAFFGMGLLNNIIPFSLIVWGQQYIASGVASILNATTPLFTVLCAHILTQDEFLTPGKFFGAVIGFFGVAIMIGAGVLQDLGVQFVAQLFCLGGALSYALAGIFGRRFRRMGISPTATATGQVIASSCILLPMAALLDKPWTLDAPSAEAVWALIGVASLSTALAYVLYFRILATAGATNLLLVTFLIPVSAIFLGTIFLGEVLEPRHLIGMALIGVGLVAIDGRVGRMLRSYIS